MRADYEHHNARSSRPIEDDAGVDNAPPPRPPRVLRMRLDEQPFFDFVLLLVTAGALAITKAGAMPAHLRPRDVRHEARNRASVCKLQGDRLGDSCYPSECSQVSP
jgi:hypothetical protein